MTLRDLVGAARDQDTKLIEQLRARLVTLEHALDVLSRAVIDRTVELHAARARVAELEADRG